MRSSHDVRMHDRQQTGECQGRGWETHFAQASRSGYAGSEPAPQRSRIALLFADAELGNYGFIPFRVVLLQVVEQATTPAHHHEKSAARAVIFLVRFEVFRQLTNALA